jgi:hypothetical protein
MYRAMVEDGFIESETNTISSREKAVVILYECRRHLYFIDSPPRMPKVTSRTLRLAPYLVHTPL